jgi:hypothetical protein
VLIKSDPPTDDKMQIARAQQVLDPTVAAEYLARLEKSSNNILQAFDQQHEKAVVIFVCI